MSFDLARFRKICGLLGSVHDGERANAAALATAMLRDAGLTWGDIIIGAAARHGPSSPAPPPSPPPPRPANWWVEAATEILMETILGDLKLSARQKVFVESMSTQAYEPTERQAHWLGVLHAMAMASKGRNTG